MSRAFSSECINALGGKGWMCGGLLVLVALFAGCATPNYQTESKTTVLSPDQDDKLGGTFIESGDLRTIAARMSSSLLSSPEISQSGGLVRIAISPVRNSSRFIVDREIFTTRLRAELNRLSENRLRFFAQGLAQETRAEILGGRAAQNWEQIADEAAHAVVAGLPTSGSAAAIGVIGIKNTNIAEANADSLLSLIRTKIAARAPGRINFLARETSGRVAEPVFAEAEMRRLNLVELKQVGGLAGAEYFLGGEFVAQAYQTAQGGVMPVGAPNETTFLNVLLIEASSGRIVVEKAVPLTQRMTSGVERADFILTGELKGLSKAAGGDRSDYVLMSFQLINPDSNEVVWEDIYETKKTTTSSVLYK